MAWSNQHVEIAASVLDGLDDPACLLDAQGVVVAVNGAWREFGAAHGAPAGHMSVGLNYFEILAEALQANRADGAALHDLSAGLRDILAGRRDRFDSAYEAGPAGEPRWFVARTTRIGDGGPVRAVMVHEDVTALTQAQDALRRSETLLQHLAASTPGTLFRMTRRDDGGWQFSYLSPGVEALFGVEARRVRGNAALLWGAVLAIDRAAFDAVFAAACARRTAWEHEFRIGTGGGAIKWIQVKAAARPGEHHEPAWTGTLIDVSERKRMEAVVHESEETFRALFEAVPQGIVYQSTDGRITAANPAAQRILGLTLAQMQDRGPLDPSWKIVHEDGSAVAPERQPAMEALRTGLPVTGVVMGMDTPARGQVWLLIDATPLFRHGKLDEVHVSFEDITARVTLERELQQQASTDYLTGVANRRVLMDRLKAEYERVRRFPERACSVVALDIDHFKFVNDAWGHAAGDAVLVRLAQLMQQESRAIDTVARSGGEEFTLLLPDTSTEAALTRAERLRERIASAAIEHEGQALTITVSMGVSTIVPTDPGIDAVLARADRALYEAKSHGRNLARLALPPA